MLRHTVGYAGMAASPQCRPTYPELKADLAMEDATILERLVERRDNPLDVITDLQIGLSESEACGRVRELLRNSIARLQPSRVARGLVGPRVTDSLAPARC